MSLYASLKKTATHILAPVALATTLAYASPTQAILPITQETKDIVTYGSVEAKTAHDDSVALYQQSIEHAKALEQEQNALKEQQLQKAYEEMQPQLETIIKSFNDCLGDKNFSVNEQQSIYFRMEGLRETYYVKFDKNAETLYTALFEKMWENNSVKLEELFENDGLDITVEQWTNNVEALDETISNYEHQIAYYQTHLVLISLLGIGGMTLANLNRGEKKDNEPS